MIAPQIDFRPFIEVAGVYDTGLTGVIANDQGQLGGTDAAGVEISGGISGIHSWRHTLLGLDYRGAYRHYDRQTYYDGSDQSLLLGLTQQLSRHTTLSLREGAGMFTRDFGILGLSQTVPFDPASTFVPTTDFFDNRTIYLSTQADLTFQKTARLSFDVGGDGFLARRRSSALYGITGGSARGDMQYRLSRRTTLGVAYNFTQYEFTHIFSGTDLHALVGAYSVRLSRNTEFTAWAGAMRAETKFIQTVPLDPVVVALLGQTQGNVIVYRVDYLPTFSARLSRTLHNGVLFASGGRTITPGNGLFLTSRSSTATIGYSYTGLRRWSFSSAASTNLSTSIGNVNGTYRGYAGTLTVSRQIRGSLSWFTSFSARRYNSPDFTGYNRTIYNVRVGFGFSPGDVPLRIW
jgi:hypothetical protein